MQDPEQYGRSFADVYDEWYSDVYPRELVRCVASLLDPGARVLELGVGTGRVSLALAAAGFAVSGLDSSADMVDRLRSKPGGAAIPVVVGDASDADCWPSGPFDAVLAVFNLLFNLTSVDAQRCCIEAAASRLAPGGRLVVEAFVPDVPTERRRELVTRSVEAHRVVLIATDAAPQDQLVQGAHIEITDSGTRLRPWTIRVALPDQLDAMAAAAGLGLERRTEDWTGTPFVPGESAHHVSVYRAVG